MFFFFFNDTATTEIYTLSLHDALPISRHISGAYLFVNGHGLLVPDAMGVYRLTERGRAFLEGDAEVMREIDRKSTRLNSSHANISYAVFCLKKKKKLSFAHRRNSTIHS